MEELCQDIKQQMEQGITSLGEDLGGLTLGEARKKINRIFDSLADSLLTVTFDGQSEQISLRELGLSWNADSALADAASLGKSGSFISRYKEKKDLQAESRDVDIVYTYDVSAIENFVREKIAVHDKEPVEATLIRDSSRNFVVTDDVHGMETDVAVASYRVMPVIVQVSEPASYSKLYLFLVIGFL